MNTILSWIGTIAVVFGIGFFAGTNARDAYYKTQLAKAKAAFELRIKEANEAAEKVDIELQELKKRAAEAPPDPRIAIGKDAAKRIGEIR